MQEKIYLRSSFLNTFYQRELMSAVYQRYLLEGVEKRFIMLERMNKEMQLFNLENDNAPDESIKKIKKEIKLLKKEEEISTDNEKYQITLTEKQFDTMRLFLSFYDSEKIKRFTNQMFFINLFTELEMYLFNISKYVLFKYPELIGDSVVEIKVLLETNFNKTSILEKKIELKLHDELFDLKKGLKFISERLKINFSINSNLIQDLIKYKVFRDVFVHGQGIINHTAKRKIKKELEIGDIVIINDDTLLSARTAITKIVEIIDRKFVEKFPECIEEPKL